MAKIRSFQYAPANACMLDGKVFYTVAQIYALTDKGDLYLMNFDHVTGKAQTWQRIPDPEA